MLREPHEHDDGETDSGDSREETSKRCEEEPAAEAGPYKVKKRPYKVKNISSSTRNQKKRTYESTEAVEERFCGMESSIGIVPVHRLCRSGHASLSLQSGLTGRFGGGFVGVDEVKHRPCVLIMG
jgi:hypothetical protein